MKRIAEERKWRMTTIKKNHVKFVVPPDVFVSLNNELNVGEKFVSLVTNKIVTNKCYIGARYYICFNLWKEPVHLFL